MVFLITWTQLSKFLYLTVADLLCLFWQFKLFNLGRKLIYLSLRVIITSGVAWAKERVAALFQFLLLCFELCQADYL